jgi:hypothetical protein
MAGKKVWRGIQNNFALFQGEVVSDPIFYNDYAFLTLRTIVVQRDTNGQIVEVDQDIPLAAEPGSPNIKVLREYVKAGRRLQVWCHYRSWELDGEMRHAFIIRKIDLGEKSFEAQSSTPPPSFP